MAPRSQSPLRVAICECGLQGNGVENQEHTKDNLEGVVVVVMKVLSSTRCKVWRINQVLQTHHSRISLISSIDLDSERLISYLRCMNVVFLPSL